MAVVAPDTQERGSLTHLWGGEYEALAAQVEDMAITQLALATVKLRLDPKDYLWELRRRDALAVLKSLALDERDFQKSVRKAERRADEQQEKARRLAEIWGCEAAARHAWVH